MTTSEQIKFALLAAAPDGKDCSGDPVAQDCPPGARFQFQPDHRGAWDRPASRRLHPPKRATILAPKILNRVSAVFFSTKLN